MYVCVECWKGGYAGGKNDKWGGMRNHPNVITIL